MPGLNLNVAANHDTSSSNQLAASSKMSRQTSPLAPPPGVRRHWAKRYRTEIAACSSSIISTFLAFPLESIKTRIQGDAPNFRYAVSDLWRHEGFRGFWRGVVAPVGSVTVVRTVTFSVYQKTKYRSSAFIGQMTGGDEPLIKVNKPGSVPDLGTMACFGFAGAAAGAVSTFIACPFELIKNGMVLSNQIAKTGNSENRFIRGSYVGKGTWATGKQIIKNCGVMGLYAGFRLQLIRETIGTGLYFMAYESGKQLLVKYSGLNSPVSPLAVAIAGGFCGMFSLAVTYPLDRAKTAYQKERLELGKHNFTRPPPLYYFRRASYQGLSVAATRSAVTNAILFTTFEQVKKFINNLEDPVISPPKVST